SPGGIRTPAVAAAPRARNLFMSPPFTAPTAHVPSFARHRHYLKVHGPLPFDAAAANRCSAFRSRKREFDESFQICSGLCAAHRGGQVMQGHKNKGNALARRDVLKAPTGGL